MLEIAGDEYKGTAVGVITLTGGVLSLVAYPIVGILRFPSCVVCVLRVRACVCACRAMLRVSCGTHVPQDQLLGAPFQFSFVVNVHQYKQAVILTTNRYFCHISVINQKKKLGLSIEDQGWLNFRSQPTLQATTARD